MEKVGKIKTIARAFTQDAEVSEKVLQERRDICKACEFHSNNADVKTLDTLQRARKKLQGEEKPFCTACGCQILEKTTRATEECGAVYKNLPPKWNRIVLETVDKIDLNYINLSHDKVNVDLSKNKKNYEVNFGEINKNDVHRISFDLKSDEGTELKISYFSPSCGSCTEAKYEKTDKNTYHVEVELNTKNINSEEFRKSIYFGYYVGARYKKNVIKMVGKLKN